MKNLNVKIGLLHLSDIHFKENDNIIVKRTSKIVDAIKTDCYHINKLYIVVSGDIAFSGKEYEIALNFFTDLQNHISEECNNLKIQFVFAPGNHDCDFSQSNKQRENNLKLIKQEEYDAIGDDSTIIDSCTSIQKNFFDFLSIYSINVENKLYYKIKDNIDDIDIIFNCYNTAWLSTKIEDPGTLFYPIKEVNKVSHNVFSINVFHHPYNWLTPKSAENNSKEFASFMQKTSNLILSGHEHNSGVSKNTNLESLKENILIEGGVLQQGNNIESKFNYINIDLIKKKAGFKFFSWEDNLYLLTNEKMDVSLSQTYNEEFKLKKEFKDFLNKTNIPILKGDESNISLGDLYIYPKLESLGEQKRKIDDFINAAKFNEITDNGYTYIIEGAEQSGKTSLCKMLYKNYYSNAFYPLFIKGYEIKNHNIKQIIKIAYRQQYEDFNSDVNYQKYLQLDKNKKILFIDNLDCSKLNIYNQDKLINELSKEYPYILITVNDTYGIEYIIKEKIELINFKQYRLLPFGYEQRNKLIEKWNLLGHEKDYDEKKLLDYAENTLRKINELLGINLMPAYPANIILLLQTLDTYLPHNLSMTSYGHCYETLIISRLSMTGIKNEQLDSYFNFITYLSFYMFDSGLETLSESNLTSFIKEQYDFALEKDIIKNLIVSGILTTDSLNNTYFKYKYIYYFFIAKYLSDNDNRETESVKKIIKNLCNNIQINRNANILIFLTHHAKDKKLLDDIQLTSMYILDKKKEICLNTDETQFMNDLVETILQRYIENKDPKKERDRKLKLQDNMKAEINDDDNDQLDDEVLIDINKALKSLEVIGQIIKNRYGSIEKEQLEDIIEVSCNTGLRALNFFIDLFQKEETEEELLKIVSVKLKDNEFNKIKIQEKIHKMLQFFSYLTCHFFINKIANSMGIKQLEPYFENLALKHGNPAYDLIHFIIKTRFAQTLNIDELKRLIKKFKKNILARDILNRIVIDYIYMHEIKFKDKQKISHILNIPIKNQLLIENRRNKKY